MGLSDINAHDQLASEFALHMAEGMDQDTMFMFVVETLRKQYEFLDKEELLQEVLEYAPHLVDIDDD